MKLQKILAVMLSSVFILAACKKEDDANLIKVGAVFSLTGDMATFGTSSVNGIKLAVEEVNAAGGINGKKVKLVSIDDQGKPEEAASAVTKLITQEKVSALLGEVASGISMVMAPIAQQYKVPMVSPSSTNPDVTKKGDFIFRVCFVDPFQGTVMAKFAAGTLKAKKVAVLTDIKNDYSMGLAQFFKENFIKLGGTIVVEQSYAAKDIDFKAQLTAIKAKNPDAIYVPGYYTEVGLIARQARELGMNIPLMGGDGWDSPKLLEIAGGALEGSYLSNHYSTEDQSPAVQNFIRDYKKAYNEVPDALAALGYDAAKILFEAMKKAPGLTSDAIRIALTQIKDYPAVTGKISIDANRDAVKSAVVLKVVGTGFKYQQTINP